MEKIYSKTRPSDIVVEKTFETYDKRILNYGIHELSKEEIQELWEEYREEIIDGDASIELPIIAEDWFIEQHRWQYYKLKFPMSVWSYDKVVEAIIRDKYSQGEMESITNNMTAVLSGFLQELTTNGIISATKWIVENIDADNTKRFSEMQQWRKHAKEIAKSIFKKEV